MRDDAFARVLVGSGHSRVRGVRGVRGINAAALRVLVSSHEVTRGLGGAHAPARPEGRHANQRLSRRAAAGAERAPVDARTLQRAKVTLSRARQGTGFTTVELLLSVSLMALAATLAGVAFTTLRQTEGERVLQALYATRAAAAFSGEPATWTEGSQMVRFYPDGSSGGGIVAVGDQLFEVDRLTGVLHAAP